MCGAIGIQYKSSYHKELLRFFSEEEIKEMAQCGEMIFAFWDKLPLLPVRHGNSIQLYEWGNRDSHVSLPKTGWARLESLLLKKWDHLQPKVVLIPADRGCEKKVWFDLDKDIRGVLVKEGDWERVYMITEEASAEFQKLTGHDRMPRLYERKIKA